LGPNAGPSAHGARRTRAHGDGTSRWLGRPRRTAPTAAEHSDTDSGKGTFGGDGTRSQRDWDGKDGEPGRRRREKPANAAVETRTR
jgi:hypothetical protein